jgi:hypothetical protein
VDFIYFGGEVGWLRGSEWMGWRVEKHDMLAGQAHGCDLQQSLGLGSGVWMKWEGREGGGHAGRTF